MSEKREIQANDVVVRLEVIVPQGGSGAGSRRTQQQLAHSPPSITEPPPPLGGSGTPSSRNVRTTNGQNFMCACGDNAAAAPFVFAMVFPSGKPPAQPPAGTLWMSPNNLGLWDFGGTSNNLEIPGVVLNQTNLLAVWSYFADDNSFHLATVPFTPIAASATQCRSSGSGGSGGAPFGVPVPRPHAGATVPRQWTVTAAGFSVGATVVFNAIWMLTLRRPAGDEAVWNNGGDGRGSPLVEMRREGSVYVLGFRYGSAEVHYIKPATEWQPLGANVLALAGKEPASGVPPALTVVPV
jgi:hypothetical protein